MSPCWARDPAQGPPAGLPYRSGRRFFGLLPSPWGYKSCNAPFRGPYAGAVKPSAELAYACLIIAVTRRTFAAPSIRSHERFESLAPLIVTMTLDKRSRRWRKDRH
jgi:hypothetical protein